MFNGGIAWRDEDKPLRARPRQDTWALMVYCETRGAQADHERWKGGSRRARGERRDGLRSGRSWRNEDCAGRLLPDPGRRGDGLRMAMGRQT